MATANGARGTRTPDLLGAMHRRCSAGGQRWSAEGVRPASEQDAGDSGIVSGHARRSSLVPLSRWALRPSLLDGAMAGIAGRLDALDALREQAAERDPESR
jgi:hypothetical protein